MQNTQRIPLGQARSLLLQLAPHFGDADRARIEGLLPWLDDKAEAIELPLKQMVERMFASHSLDEGLKVFTNLRGRINKAAKAHNLSFGFNADTRKTTPIEERVCYFVGVCVDEQEAEHIYQDQSGGGIDDYIEAVGSVENSKPRIRFFVSYAHKYDRQMATLLERLQDALKLDPDFEFVGWNDQKLVTGQQWEGEILAKIEDSDLGLMLLTTPYLASDFCQQELRAYLHKNGTAIKALCPVALGDIPLDEPEKLLGLGSRQVFRFNSKKCYAKCKGEERQEFANQLAKDIEKQARDLFGHRLPDKVQPTMKKQHSIKTDHELLTRQSRALFEPDIEQMVNSTGQRDDIGNPETPQKTKSEGGELVQAYLQEWLADDQRAYFCLLGEYGMGKTVNCQEFAKTLLEQRQADASIRLPFYFDLRNMRASRQELDKLAANGEWFSIEEVINRLIKRGWQSTATPQLTGKRVLELLRADQAVVMFDGLDEVIVGMTAKEGSQFIQTLWNALPPNTAYKTTTQAGKPAHQYQGGKLLISCRSHYFRDMAEQNSLFLAQDRSGFKPDYYAAMTILPFDANSVRQYLSLHFSTERAAQVEALINTVHNLEELSGRPYLLSLIREVADKLEQEKRDANIVNTASLYRQIVDRWLTRDEGKHQIDRLHKTELMEHLAAELWNSGERSWPVQKLEKWLDRFLLKHPEIKDALKDKAREIIKEDLRTATFIVRPDEDQFRFAHTSFQEYFLACYLYKALAPEFSEDLAPEKWALEHTASPETLDFVADLIEQAKDQQALTGIETLLRQNQARASEQALHYWLRARERNRPCPQPQTLDFPGLDFAELRLSGRPDNPLKLRNSCFTGAKLRQSRFEYIDFSGADFTHAMLNQSEFNHCQLDHSQFAHARLAGAVLRHCRLTNSDLQSTTQQPSINTDHLQRIQCTEGAAVQANPQKKPLPADSVLQMQSELGHQRGVMGCAFSPDGQLLLSASEDKVLKLWDAYSGECLQTFRGHRYTVTSCAFSPDGQQLLSASEDKLLKLWDARSGECLQTFRGHHYSVMSCAFSPDGQQLLSASTDTTLKLWDVCSGECLHTLNEHQGWVMSCAFSPDGQQLLSASTDNTLKLWDAHSGECLQTFRGHLYTITSCAFSPDGQHLLSASHDKALKLWDTHSGECLQTFRGHLYTITSCAFSPDGQRLLSVSEDKTLKLWDAHNGECLQILTGYQSGVLSCAFSPDGQQLLSASYDKTLKLWDAYSGECLQIFNGHQGTVLSCAFSPDGQWLLSASHDKTLKLWDAYSGECLRILTGHQSGVLSCAFSPDGQQLLSASYDKTLKLWDAYSGECLQTFNGHQDTVLSCAFSPDGEWLLSASEDKTLKLWDVHSGECLQMLKGHQNRVWGCAFSPDGEWLLSASEDNTLKIWSAQSGKCLQTFNGHQNGFFSCVFSPNGQQLLSASEDKKLKLWDMHNGECLQTFRGHKDMVWNCAFSPDGQQLLSASADNTLKLWDAHSGECLRTHTHLPEQAWASIADNQLQAASDNAWRYLGWFGQDATTGKRVKYPLEYWQPLQVQLARR